MGVYRKKRLGELLVEKGIITKEQLKDALALQKSTGKKLGEILISQNLISESQMAEVLQEQLGIPFVDLNKVTLDPKLTEYVPFMLAKRHSLIPIKLENGKLYIAMEDPLDFAAIDDVKRVSKMDVVPLISFGEAIRNAIHRLYGMEYAERAVQDYTKEAKLEQLAQDIQNGSFDEDVSNAPVVRLVNSIIQQAINMGASDIHIEPMEGETRVRLRIDGMLQKALNIPKYVHPALVTRIKIMGNMDIAEKRLPQDGRVGMQVSGKDIDLRISTIPTIYGEKVVIRVLDQSNFLLPKEKLGFTQENLEKFDELLKNPHGIILVTGPTGSGKSTTLYAMLNELNRESVNIITIEDPVEYRMEGISQIQVNPKAGLTFAAGLRSIVRQDPDIIMVGEIRDGETAEIAIRSAITGHLVLSTLHTNDAVSAISRLMDMGIEPYLISAALVGVISQRLLRKVCSNCRVPYEIEPHHLATPGFEVLAGVTLYRGKGCSACNYTGYKGRVPVHEILVISKQHRQMIAQRASIDEIRDLSIKMGMSTLKDECIKLVMKGLTTIDEVIRVSYSQDV
ncbi:type IV pilus assembly protein PilB [Caldicoprobacter guelmensis]|uniref:GspE/PulE family protein n=1 Tax=Caldicoprobacter guelmensis TaxID=1170224 RepID=UPI0019590151|nr:GspE/PulE family protein [Caldicoprobacter guelmensis]MBM7581263.1 type IV pilus assembly protein PilB [Caldicoprobacter guelmensis]